MAIPKPTNYETKAIAKALNLGSWTIGDAEYPFSETAYVVAQIGDPENLKDNARFVSELKGALHNIRQAAAEWEESYSEGRFIEAETIKGWGTQAKRILAFARARSRVFLAWLESASPELIAPIITKIEAERDSLNAVISEGIEIGKVIGSEVDSALRKHIDWKESYLGQIQIGLESAGKKGTQIVTKVIDAAGDAVEEVGDALKLIVPVVLSVGVVGVVVWLFGRRK